MIEVSEARTDELDAWLGVRNSAYPWLRLGRSDLERERAESHAHVLLVGRVDGQLAGCGRALLDDVTDTDAQLGVWVMSSGRRQGLGGALFGRLCEHARRWGAAHVGGITLEGSPGEAFARSHGLEVESRLHAARLDLARAPTVDLELPPNVDEIVPLDRAPELARSAWEVVAEGQADLPGGAAGDVAPFAAWEERRRASSPTSRALSLVAVADAAVVGWVALEVREGDPSVGLHELTAVRRSWRGRGVATALKRHQIARARELGLAWLHASNDDENAGIRSVNRRLGYRPQPVRVWMRGPLPERD